MRRELPLLFAMFLDLVGFGMAFPDIQLRAEEYALEAGISEPGLIIGFLLASYFLIQILASPRWGKLSDRIGRKPVLLICTALSAGSMLVYAHVDSLTGILLSRIFAGFAAANVVVAQAYISDTSTPETKSKSMGRVSAAISVGLIIGPALGGYLADAGGNYLMGMVAAAMSALSFVWIWFGVPNTAPTAKREPGKSPAFDLRLLKDIPNLIPLFVITAVGWFALACLEGTFGRLIKLKQGMNREEFGWIFSYESLIVALIGAYLIGKLTERFDNRFLLRVSYSLQALGLGFTPFAKEFTSPFITEVAWLGLGYLFLCSTFYAIGSGIGGPVLNALCSQLTPENRQGELFGLMQATRSFGFLLGPQLGGALFDFKPELPFVIAALTCGIAALLIPRSATAANGA